MKKEQFYDANVFAEFTCFPDFCSPTSSDCSSHHLHATYPLMILPLRQQSPWDYVDHCPLIYCYLLLLLLLSPSPKRSCMLAFVDQLVPSIAEKNRRKSTKHKNKLQSLVKWIQDGNNKKHLSVPILSPLFLESQLFYVHLTSCLSPRVCGSEVMATDNGFN